MDSRYIKIGQPSPLGANISEQGINFALFSKHARHVTLCLMDVQSKEIIARVPLDPEKHRTGHIWHVYVEGLKLPLLYGYRDECFVFSDLESVFRNGEKAFELPESLKHRRSHDLENWMAAYALCADRGIGGELFLKAAQSFQKPAHRIEFVKELHGVRYIDDSKGTNIDAVIRAVQSLEGPIILIAGGVDKGSSYTPWLKEFKDKVKLICVIGQAAAKINAQLSEYLPVKAFDTLDAAVHYAASVALNGDCVLLSPGCSSFDMFKDYAHRGCEFQRIVREMEEEEK